MKICSPHTNTSPLPQKISQTREHLDPNAVRFRGWRGGRAHLRDATRIIKGKEQPEASWASGAWAGQGTGVGRAGHREQKPRRRRSFQHGLGRGEGLLQGRPKAAATRASPPCAGPGRGAVPGASGAAFPRGSGKEREGAGGGWRCFPASAGALPWARKGVAGRRRPRNEAAPLPEADGPGWGGEQDPPARPCPAHRRLRGSRTPPPSRSPVPGSGLFSGGGGDGVYSGQDGGRARYACAGAARYARNCSLCRSSAVRSWKKRVPRWALELILRMRNDEEHAGNDSSLGVDAWEAAPIVPPRLGGRVRAAGGDKTRCAFSARAGARQRGSKAAAYRRTLGNNSWPPLLERNMAGENITPTPLGYLQFSNLKRRQVARGVAANPCREQ